jgi:hypothetical protein
VPALESRLADLREKIAAIHREPLGEFDEIPSAEEAHLAEMASAHVKAKTLADLYAEIAKLTAAEIIRETEHDFESNLGGMRIKRYAQKQFDAKFWRDWIRGPKATDAEREAAEVVELFDRIVKPAETAARESGEFSQLSDRLKVSILK